jgi:pyrroline-5-carboxylate reductase
MSDYELIMVGGGRMGEALLGGLLAGGMLAGSVLVVEPLAARRDELTGTFPGLPVVEALGAGSQRGDGAIIAVKPQHVEEACAAVGPLVPRALSIAAGVPIEKLQRWLGPTVAVVRSMPNTPALVGAGASAMAGGATATAADLDWAAEILGAVGVVAHVGEGLLDAVTGLSGSGPAYVFLVAEAMIEAGVLVGLPRDTASLLARQTILGAARLLSESGDLPEVLRANVTSPGGTTAAGLRALEQHGVRAAFLDAVSAATERARVLGS